MRRERGINSADPRQHLSGFRFHSRASLVTRRATGGTADGARDGDARDRDDAMARADAAASESASLLGRRDDDDRDGRARRTPSATATATRRDCA